MIEIRQLITFLKITELQSFSRAASALGYTQSAVTIQVKQMEEDLNIKLFDRIGKSVSLTPPGKELLKYAQSIMIQMYEAEKMLGKPDTVEHTLHIGTIESLCYFKLPSIIQYFYKHFPQTRIKITTDSPRKLIAMMERNQVDIIYILDKPLYDITWEKVLEQQEYIVFVSSSQSPFASQTSVSLEELLQQPFVLTEKEDNYRYSLYQYLASKNLSVHPFLELGNTEVIINMVKNNMGLSFLPNFAVAESVEKRELSVLPVPDFQMSMARQVIYHKDKWLTEEMKEFIRLAKLGMV